MRCNTSALRRPKIFHALQTRIAAPSPPGEAALGAGDEARFIGLTDAAARAGNDAGDGDNSLTVTRGYKPSHESTRAALAAIHSFTTSSASRFCPAI